MLDIAAVGSRAVTSILVTGGAGFIGSNLVERLSRLGHEVRVLDDLSTGLRSNLDGLRTELIVGSFTNPHLLAEVASGVECIVHLGARGSVPRSIADPVATHEVNATGTLNVLMAALAVGAHVIVASSSSVYGENVTLPKQEEMWMQPMSPYGASKLAAESYTMAFQKVYGLEALVTRFFNVYGPKQRPDHDYAAVIPKFAYAALHGKPIQVHGDGKQSRDFTYVASVVDLLKSAVERRLTHDRPVNVAFGNPYTVLDVVEGLETIVGQEIATEFVAARAGDVPHSANDPELLKQLFPDVAEVPLAVGLRKTYDWLSAAHA